MNTVLGTNVQTKKAIVINDRIRQSGMYVLGATGQGKSLLLASLIYQDALKDYAEIVIDPHGDLIEHVISILPEKRLEKTYLLDLRDKDYPFGLNLFSCLNPVDEIEQAITVDRVMHVFAKIWPETKGILLEKLLRFVTLTIMEHPDCTLVDVESLLWDDAFRANIVRSLSNQEVKSYWERDYNSMTLGEKRREIQALDNRLAALRTTPIVKNIVSQRKTTIDFVRAIQEREILLIHLPAGMKNAADLIGTILLSQIHAATFAFAEIPRNQRPGFSLFVDEFQHYATSDFAEMIKEGRKFGARITIAHQDRRDLLPENRSATLLASTIISFRSTPEDAIELAPLLFDASAKLHPERIYSDVLHRIRNHKHREVQDYYRRYILPLQQTGVKRTDDRELLELLQDILYQAVRTSTINEELFKAYAQGMFPRLKLTYTAPQQKQKRIQEELRLQQYRIAKLQSFLTDNQAFEPYLVDYYTYYSLYNYYHPTEWYYQPWIPEEHLLSDTKLWGYVWGYRRHVPWQPRSLETVITSLREEAAANEALGHRNTPERLVADEKAKLVAEWRHRFQEAWDGITKIYELISKYAIYEAIRAFYSQEYQRCTATPVEQKPEPFYLDIIEQKGMARTPGLVIQLLPLEANKWLEISSWLPSTLKTYYDGYRPSQEEALRAFDTVRKLWSTITWCASELQRIKRLISDDKAILIDYYAKIGKTRKGSSVWEQMNNENVESNVWKALDKEARRNALLSHELNTVEKIIEARKNEVRKKIALLTREQETYLTALPEREMRIQQEIASIQERRTAFENYVHRIITILIEDPDVLGEPRKPKESDAKEKLLTLQKRQALIRVSGDTDRKTQICTMKTADVPQAAKKEEVERRQRQIRERTRAKYCQYLGEAKRELHGESMNIPNEGELTKGETPDSWYEE